MKREEIENGLTSPNLEIRKLFAEDKGVFHSLSEYQIKRGMSDINPLIRYIFVKMCHECNKKITSEQRKLIQKDKDPNVQKLIKKNDNNINLEDVSLPSLPPSVSRYELEKGLISQYPRIRLLFNKRFLQDDNIIKLHQLERGLTDKDLKVRKSFCDRDFQFYTKRQVARGINDSDSEISNIFVGNSNITISNKQAEDIFKRDVFDVINTFVHRVGVFTKEQLELCLTSKYQYIRASIAQRKVKLTDEQIKRGLNDKSEDVVNVFTSRRDSLRFVDYKKIEQALTSRHDFIRLEMSKRDDIKLNKDQINRGLGDKNEYVRGSFAKRADFNPNEEQINSLIDDSCVGVILNLLNRNDITLKLEQVQTLLDFSDNELLNVLDVAIRKRPEYADYKRKKTLGIKAKSA